MSVARAVTLVGLAFVCVVSADAHPGGSKPSDWSTYELLDIRNPGSPVGLIEYRHKRTSPYSVSVRTHLLLRMGTHWRDATPHRLKWYIDDAYFLDANRGWLITADCSAGKGELYRTRDGGRTWQHLSPGWSHGCAAGSEFRLAFADKRHGWILSPAPTAPADVLFRTRDGGRTWAYNEGHDIPVFDDITLSTARVGWGIAFLWSIPSPLYRTENSGKTWQPVTRIPRARYSLPVFFGKTGIVMATRRGVATFYRTTDAGRRWRTVCRLDVHGLRFPDFRAPTALTWWVFGVQGSTPAALVTNDSGRSWSRSNVPGRAYYAQLGATPQRAWLTATPLQGEGALFSSRDNRRTWTRMAP